MPSPTVAKPQPPTPQRRGGRPKAFEGETVKVALFLPPDLAGTLKAFAAKHRQTPSNIVADWIQDLLGGSPDQEVGGPGGRSERSEQAVPPGHISVAEIREAIAQGREAFETGDVVTHEEALQRLSKW